MSVLNISAATIRVDNRGTAHIYVQRAEFRGCMVIFDNQPADRPPTFCIHVAGEQRCGPLDKYEFITTRGRITGIWDGEGD